MNYIFFLTKALTKALFPNCGPLPFSVLLGMLFVLVWLLLVMPFWAISDCALFKRPLSRKAAWLTGIILSWSLGATIYAFFSPKETYLRKAAYVALLSCVFLINIPVSYTHLRAHETDSYLVC